MILQLIKLLIDKILKTMFTAEIDGKEVELSPDQIKAKEDGYGVITPDNVPKGYFNEEAVNKIVKDNVNKISFWYVIRCDNSIPILFSLYLIGG